MSLLDQIESESESESVLVPSSGTIESKMTIGTGLTGSTSNPDDMSPISSPQCMSPVGKDGPFHKRQIKHPYNQRVNAALVGLLPSQEIRDIHRRRLSGRLHLKSFIEETKLPDESRMWSKLIVVWTHAVTGLYW